MRSFIAIDLPEEIKARIFHESEILEEKIPDMLAQIL